MKIVHGDIFEDDADAIVIPVNCVGVMGKGLALEAKKRSHLDLHDFYLHMADELRPGQIIHWCDNFTFGPCVWLATTKDHWRKPSRIEWVDSICKDLAAYYERFGADEKSFAVPALGCGEGGLSWDDVLPIMERHFANLNVRVYAPKESR